MRIDINITTKPSTVHCAMALLVLAPHIAPGVAVLIAAVLLVRATWLDWKGR